MSKTKLKEGKFFLDVFNNILDYNESKVIVFFDTDGNIWFGLKDLLKMLGYTSTLNQLNTLDITKTFIRHFNEIKVTQLTVLPQNFQKNTLFVNESGLYELLTKSTKSIAKEFLNKYLIDIMPQIRKTGKYISNNNDINKIKKLNDKINNYKLELNYYDDKYKFEQSPNGYLYINQDVKINNGIKIKCYKVGYTLDMKKRINQYKVGNFTHKLLGYIPLQIDRKAIEQCVKSRLKPHLTKLITDTVCYIGLNELKEQIIDCINFTNEHICHCVKCSKTYKLKSINSHKCNISKVSNIIDYKTNNTKKLSRKSTRKTTKSSKRNKRLSKK